MSKPKTHILSAMSDRTLCGRGTHYLIQIRDYRMVMPTQAGEEDLVADCRACRRGLIKADMPAVYMPLLRPKREDEK